MKKLKFIFGHPGYLFYYAVMAVVLIAFKIYPDSFIMAPLGVQIGIVFTIVVGTGGMIYHMITTYKAE